MAIRGSRMQSYQGELPSMTRRNGKGPGYLFIESTPVGLGVFTSRTFRRGTAVGRIRGEIVEDPDYGSDYCIDLGDGKVLEPARPWRLLNHSCHPNCEVVAWEGEKGDRLWLVARRWIKPGEQLTIDYAWPADVAIPCRCGARNCRGWIVDSQELELLPQGA
jgi:hypothetical protein